MAKKKYSTKKHRFKATEAGGAGLSVAAENSSMGSPIATSMPKAAATTQHDFNYVLLDLRQIAAMAIGLIGLEVVLWYVLSHTAAGSAVYNLVGR